MPPALLVFEVIRLHLLEAALMRSVGFGDTGSAPPDRMLQGHSSSIALLACLPTPFVKVTCRYHGTVFTHVNGCAQLPVRSGLSRARRNAREVPAFLQHVAEADMASLFSIVVRSLPSIAQPPFPRRGKVRTRLCSHHSADSYCETSAGSGSSPSRAAWAQHPYLAQGSLSMVVHRAPLRKAHVPSYPSCRSHLSPFPCLEWLRPCPLRKAALRKQSHHRGAHRQRKRPMC
eukprot:gnl/TRDRNA2_/TRDRNA2_167760_c0_seq4.p1 gnl/TRDRNA2_/TRDRNA2_167760_c0~~gnl/TRDRNA2_/TRDRNA2_167760_c0_seq4.p1  ORF type:complete len:231 (+),score=11.37 gnl/TRDRNA2_/TRDRNA2_167760_c0_seq4:61-753(+)